jgi:RNA polymerase sigma-70 factor, ECF subfamily
VTDLRVPGQDPSVQRDGTGPTLPSEDAGFRALFHREAGYVWATLRRLGVHPSDVEDVTQEVMLRVFRLQGDYDPSRPLRPWIFGIAHRVAAEWRRHRRRHPEDPTDFDDRDLASTQGDAEAAVAARQAKALVERALLAVEVDRRAVFILHDLEGCPAPDIARTLEIPVNTAYSRLRLAREEFRAEVARLHSGRTGR